MTTPHKEAPASKDGWAREKAIETAKDAARFVLSRCREGDPVALIEAALLEAEERGRHDGYHVGFNEGTLHCGDEALLRDSLKFFEGAGHRGSCLRGDLVCRCGLDEHIQKLRARLTPKGTSR